LVNPTVLTDGEWKIIQVPTLFTLGEDEKRYSAHEAIRRLETVAPQIEAELIPNAGVKALEKDGKRAPTQL
jgi:pimeloyl-ACP methyl ester carboxylesterase